MRSVGWISESVIRHSPLEDRRVTPSANPPYGTDISAMRKLPVVPTCRTPARLPVTPDTLHLRRHPASTRRGVSRSSRT